MGDMFCASCGMQIADRASFCPKCGAPTRGSSGPARRGRNPLITVLLIVIAIMVVGGGVVVFVIGSVAIPKMQSAARKAAELSAVQQIRAVQVAQVQYFSQYGRYAASLDELGPPAGGGAGPSSADLIPADLASGVKGGYRFTLQGTGRGYQVHALPVAYGKISVRNFYTDESLTIRQNIGPAPATETSEELR